MLITVKEISAKLEAMQMQQEGTVCWQFFVMFSRFEYALKRDSRYLMPGIGNAEPNWDRFGSDHNAKFSSVVNGAIEQAVDYYIANPPRKQLRTNGVLHWSNPIAYDGNSPLLIWLLTSIRHMRNNLFHGGKYPAIPIKEPSRDRELVLGALAILTECLALDDAIRSQFVADFE